jgi:subtilisin family serine protease
VHQSHRRGPLRASLLLGIVSSLTAAAGIAAPAGHLQQIPLAGLKAKAAADAPAVHAGLPVGRNQHVRPQSSRNRFTAEPDHTGTDVYIVRLHDLPAASYDGRVHGYAATRDALKRHGAAHGPPKKAGAAVAAYRQYLHDQQKAVMKAAKTKGINGAMRHQFTDALDAFTIELTQKQAAALAQLPQVDYVLRSGLRPLLTDRGPEFIGAKVVWDGGSYLQTPYQGEGMVVGMLDTGVNTDHPSFAAVGGDGYHAVNPFGAGNYLGDCATAAATCNDKLIGIWSWPLITDTYNGIRPPSGEDYNGHGSHTASTAAGNVEYNVPLLGSTPGDGHGTPSGFTFDRVSGVAPHANIIAYQVCFPTEGCPDEAILLATEQAISDGVDVINFSIGGSERFPWNDPIALAFLAARDAGISIASAAGNEGPDFFTADHSAPWYLPVAASTHDRVLDIPPKLVTLSGGASTPPAFDTGTTSGISAAGISNGDVVGADAFGDALCLDPFAPATFTSNQIVVCQRGTNARVSKAFNVLAGGAGGFVLVNAGYPDDLDDLDNDVYPLAGVQLTQYAGQQLSTWLADGGATHQATITATTITRTLDPAAGDRLAAFSSRGPSSTWEGGLTPGISAPGVDIFAAYADEHPFDAADTGQSSDWSLLSGTSMASPHVAGTMTLVRQAHPDWTPAEVQSALQMTASDTVTYQDTQYQDPRPARTYRAGSGRVDALASVNAGLVMDETAANFTYANPDNGGDALQLNLPQLVNSHCRDICSWIRTVRATRAGTWNVSGGEWTYDRWNTGEGEIQENGVKLAVYPSTFSLQAGETKSLLVRVDLTDTQFRHDAITHNDNAEQTELWSKLSFTPTDTAIPAAHWPISVNFDHGVLPRTLELNAHRDQGSYRLQGVELPALASATYRNYGLTKATVQDIALNQDIDHVPPMFDNDFSQNNWKLILIDVPAGSSRLVTEVLKNLGTTADVAWKAGWATLYVGIDSNNDGQPDFANELLCMSGTEVELNYCDISHPDPGKYWVFVNNDRTGLADGDPEVITDSYRIATAVVPGSSDGSLAVSGPAATTGTPVNLDVNWNLPVLSDGDVVYGAFDVGAGNAPGNVGFVPVKITRGLDDVSMTTSQTRARAGDVIDVGVHVRENDSGADRTFNLQSLLPPGLTLVPGSATISTSAQRGNLHVDGNTISVAGTQVDSENWPHDYAVTTSDDDALCRTPIVSNGSAVSTGGFIGLVNRFGFTPDMGGHPDFSATDAVTLPLSQFWDGGWSLYNNNAFMAYPALNISPQGWVILEPGFGDTMYLSQQFPYYTFPYTPMIGVLWKGVGVGVGIFGAEAIDALATPLNVDFFDPSQMSGMTVGYANDSHDLILEWVGARTEHTDFNTFETTTLDDRYDFELLINRDTRYSDGQYEMIMAYGNLNFGAQGGGGSIGVQGYSGPLTSFGPLDGDLWVDYAYNDLQTKLHSNKLVCYDYRGPESTQYDLAFKARVAETAAGTSQLLRFTSHVDGMPDRNVDAVIDVAGSMAIGAIGNQVTFVNTTLAGIPVVYQDNDGTPDTISVTGAHVTAVVHGNNPGDTFDLIPEPGFEGPTIVTVTVTDQNNPADQVSTTFKLTVTDPDKVFADGFE